ncbi:MAG: hypothetical protein ACT4OZ_01650 [Gemmatimonadota bacterium]
MLRSVPRAALIVVAAAVLSPCPADAAWRWSHSPSLLQSSQSVPANSPDQVTSSVRHDSLTLGGRVIAAGEVVVGPVVTAGGNVDIYGTIQGNVVAIAGDVIVHPGGRITGDAIAAFGDVHADSGVVVGTAQSLTGLFGASVRSFLDRRSGDERSEAGRPRSPLGLAVAWLVVMLVIGIAVFLFAGPYLDGVSDVLGQSFWKSFWSGVLAEAAVLPVIVLIAVALTITVIGVLLIPFAVVAAILAVAGLATLGFVAAARVTGDGLGSSSNRGAISMRGETLRGVALGTLVYMGLWVVAALTASVPLVGTLVKMFALLLTYVAVTAGFGAAILSRGGTRRDAAVAAPLPPAEVGWQTPTPVSGVVAAARRTPSPR